MAKNFQSKISVFDNLKIFDVNIQSSERFLNEARSLGRENVIVVANAHEVAENSEVIITVLPDSSIVKDVFHRILQPLTSDNFLPNLNRLFIDCSTIDPITSKEISKAILTGKKGQFVDAPMSGGVSGASTGSLTFMLGSPGHMVSRVEKILLLMGKKVLHCGPQGSGLSGKLANNYLLAINNIATAEAMRLGIKWGLEPRLLATLINSSTGRCWPSEFNNPVRGVIENSPASRDYTGGFSLGLMKKDLSLAINCAKEVGVRLGLGEKAREIYEDADAQENCKGRDFSVVYKYLTEST